MRFKHCSAETNITETVFVTVVSHSKARYTPVRIWRKNDVLQFVLKVTGDAHYRHDTLDNAMIMSYKVDTIVVV